MAERGTGIFLGDKKVNILQNGDMLVANPFSTEYTIEYLVYAGGGTGGNRLTYDGGGAGAGGLLSGSFTADTSQIYQVKAGGAANDSYLTGSGIYEYTFAGGDGGYGNNVAGSTGGSGGGGGGNIGAGGSGTVGQGNNGATALGILGGGGGGASTQGGLGGSYRNAGAGLVSSISGTSLTYCAGGAGGANGGTGRDRGDGGYGGSSAVTSGGIGGIGGVIIRYLGPQRASGGTVTTDGDYIIHTFENTTTTLIT